jgi:hypothetical protein
MIPSILRDVGFIQIEECDIRQTAPPFVGFVYFPGTDGAPEYQCLLELVYEQSWATAFCLYPSLASLGGVVILLQ